MFRVYLKRMYILLFLDGMFCIYLLSLSRLMCCSKPLFTYWFFCLSDLSIDINGVVKSPAVIVFLSISPFVSVNICFIYLGAPICVVHRYLQLLYPLIGLTPLSLCNALFCLLLQSFFQSLFWPIQILLSELFSPHFVLHGISLYCFQSIYFFRSEVSLF